MQSMTPLFGLDRLRNHSPVDGSSEHTSCPVCLNETPLFCIVLLIVTMEPSTTKKKMVQEEPTHSSQEEAVFDVEEHTGTENPTEENNDSHIPPAEMEYLKSKIHVRLKGKGPWRIGSVRHGSGLCGGSK